MHPKDNFERDETGNLVAKEALGDQDSTIDKSEAKTETSSTGDVSTQPLSGSDVSPSAEQA